MEKYDEEIFEAVADIVASALEENEVDINAEGGRKVAEFFLAIYDALEAGFDKIVFIHRSCSFSFMENHAAGVRMDK